MVVFPSPTEPEWGQSGFTSNRFTFRADSRQFHTKRLTTIHTRIQGGGNHVRQLPARQEQLKVIQTTCVRWRISLTLHGTLSKCIVGPSVLSVPWPRSKVENFSTFQAATDPSANQIAGMQKQAGRSRKNRAVIFFKRNVESIGLFLVTWSFVFISTHRLC